MNNSKSDDVVFETTANCAVLVAAVAFAALLYGLITAAVPLLQSMVLQQVHAATLYPAPFASAQAPKTLVAVWAHADDEGAAAPVLARYAREGVRVYMVIATDGAQGGAHTSIPRGPELARARADEARCATDALGLQPPILLGFPDAELGSYMEDPGRLFRVTARVQAELQRLQPDALITWGPDGGTGHPDHRLVSSIVTQLVRAGAPGAPERLFYASLPLEEMRAFDPSRQTPPFLMPLPKYFSIVVGFKAEDFAAARGSMACHKTQYSNDMLQRMFAAMSAAETRELKLAPLVPTLATNDLFGR